jgi:hypothetical protein
MTIYELHRDGVLIYTGTNKSYVDEPLVDGVRHNYTLRIKYDDGTYSAFIGPVVGCTSDAPEPVTRVSIVKQRDRIAFYRPRPSA